MISIFDSVGHESYSVGYDSCVIGNNSHIEGYDSYIEKQQSNIQGSTMQGQYTNQEIMEKMCRATNIVFINPWTVKILFGKTWNFYIMHSDNSWTNVDCQTKG